MDRITLRGRRLYHGAKLIGPSGVIYAYPGEARGLGEAALGVVSYATPYNIDLVFVAGERVVGCEVKRCPDLVQSWQTRRLHRQLRVLTQAVDVPVLVIRGLDVAWLVERVVQTCRKPQEFWGDWVKWQTQGLYILPVPTEAYLPELRVYQAALGTNGRQALAGSDQHKERSFQPGWLLRVIPGIGEVKSRALIHTFGTSLATLEAAVAGGVAANFGPALERKLRQAAEE